MKLGLEGRTALIGGASRGLGRGCAEALAEEGVAVTLVARTAEDVARAAEEIGARTGAKVQGVAADLATEEGRAAALKACPRPDILVNNAGGPPPGNFRTYTREMWLKALDTNLLSAVELIRLTLDGMAERRFGRIVNITSGAVKSPIPVLGLSNAARSGLTGFVGGIAREVAERNVTINNMLPGQFDTDRMRSAHGLMAKAQGVSSEAFREAAAKRIPAHRFGTAAEFGKVCAFLCSEHAGFITAQNILLDGGAYPGLL
ncbi:MAG: SDR family oxidoreductase [Alphaproteobacteria bacterium]|nr:SDR family oxidoreductase [Alphaproteobacteria bacterium]